VLFNILIHNTDDHLCDHGFFIDDSGIRLSPADDMNPSIDRQDLTLAINDVETTCDVSIAMDARQDYGLNTQEAGKALQQVQDAVAGWRGESDPPEHSTSRTRSDDRCISSGITLRRRRIFHRSPNAPGR
jgi:serine/threonine-protein kinase HipA